MPLAILILAFLVPLGWMVDFLVGDVGDRKLRERLTQFYIAVEEGDWAYLYSTPASLVLRFVTKVFGKNTFSLEFMTRSVLYSIAMTLSFFILSMAWSYVYSALNESGCPLPSLGQFIEIPAFMSNFLFYIVLINIPFDYISWSATSWGLAVLATDRGLRPLLVVLAFPVAAAIIVWALYLIYLPLSIVIEARQFGLRFGWAGYMHILRVNIPNISTLFLLPSHLFSIECRNRSHPIFDISYINTMQIAATETVVPLVLLLISSVAGILVYASRSFTRRPLSFLLERLDSSQKRVFALLAGVLWAVLTVVAALANYWKR